MKKYNLEMFINNTYTKVICPITYQIYDADNLIEFRIKETGEVVDSAFAAVHGFTIEPQLLNIIRFDEKFIRLVHESENKIEIEIKTIKNER